MAEKIISKRFDELDILRGLAIAIMIVADTVPAETYALLMHAQWEGLTIADLAFPGFVFAMGTSAAISSSRKKISMVKIFKRSAILFLLGIFFNLLPFVFAYFLTAEFFSQVIEHGRFFGILQRLALTYFLGMILVKFLESDKKLLIAAFAILFLYSAGFHIYSPENPFSIEKNLSSTIDLVFPGVNHIYCPDFIPGYVPRHDPEGLYGTLSSVAEFIFGFLAGKILLQNISANEKIYNLLIGGIIFFICGIIWSNFDIISKNLWTSPYTLITSSIEIFLLAGFLKFSLKSFLKPFKSLGKNALFFFFALNFTIIFLTSTYIGEVTVFQWLFENTVQGIVSEKFSSMLFTFMWLIIFIFIAEILDRKKIFIKV